MGVILEFVCFGGNFYVFYRDDMEDFDVFGIELEVLVR